MSIENTRLSAGDIARNYDVQRRLEATKNIATIWGILLFLFVVAVSVFVLQNRLSPIQLTSSVITIALLLCGVLLFGMGSWFARRKLLISATGSTIIATNLAIIAFEVFWVFLVNNGLDPAGLVMLGAAGLAIAIAGVLGEQWMIIATNILMNVMTISISVFKPGIDSFAAQSSAFQAQIDHERALFLPLALLIQWAFTSVLLIMARGVRGTLNDLGEAYVQTQKLDALKDQFITNVNHELRTPIMALQGFVELVRMRHLRVAPRELSPLLDKACQAGTEVVDLMESILNTQELQQDSHVRSLQAVNLKDVLTSATNLVDPREGQFGTRDLHLQVPSELAIYGDPIWMRQIFINLLSNALKYSEIGTPIMITAQVPDHPTPRIFGQQRVPPQVHITVQDFGYGVPPDQKELLFHRFARLPRDLASNKVGNGLGLFLCRELTEAMHGRIWLESTGVPGDGTKFHIELPLA
jgi:signal transduction histidine kinase